MSKQLYLSLLDTERNRELRDLAKARAKAEGRTQSDVIASALAAYLGKPDVRMLELVQRLQTDAQFLELCKEMIHVKSE